MSDTQINLGAGPGVAPMNGAEYTWLNDGSHEYLGTVKCVVWWLVFVDDETMGKLKAGALSPEQHHMIGHCSTSWRYHSLYPNGDTPGHLISTPNPESFGWSK